ncbi:unnamed protein product [Rhodiola kirilowii]
MEFLDEESRPRVLFQSRAQPSSAQSASSESKSLNKLLICITTSIAILLFVLTFLFVSNHEPLTSILLWIAVSVLVGPFAPAKITGGDVRVGNGSVVEDLETDPFDTEVRKPKQQRGGNWRKNEEISRGSDVAMMLEKKDTVAESEKRDSVAEDGSGSAAAVVEDKEWTEEDFELLKKQMVKNPVGRPRRWEVIAEAFQGRHKVDSVVKMAKSMAERKIGNGDSYAQFLKHRKPLDSRAAEGDNDESVAEESKKDGGLETGWSLGEDKALLNALKAFPKDVPMRWEKISAAVPGRSKKACMKRVADMKKDFRSTKAS